MSFPADFLKAIDFVVDSAFKNVGGAAYNYVKIIESEISKSLSHNENGGNKFEEVETKEDGSN